MFSLTRKLVFSILLIMTPLLLVAQQVNNIVPRIEGNTVIINYVLIVTNPNAKCEVIVYFGSSNSQTQKLINGEGEIGENIDGGINKEIIVSNINPFIPYQKNLTFRIEATFTYNPKEGAISIITKPNGAILYIDKEKIGTSDIEIPFHAIGRYNLRIEHEGYLTIEKDIDVKENETTSLIEILNPGYRATIVSEPTAELSLNGKDIGLTPIDVALKSGENLIALSRESYHDFNATIRPSKQGDIFEYKLLEKTFPVTITSYPKKTNLRLEGNLYNIGDALTLSTGDKELSISRTGYKTYKGNFLVIDVDKAQKFNYLLEPSKYREKTVAVIYSLLLPGMGQHYLKRRGLEPAMGILGYGLLVGSYTKHNNAVATYDLYLASADANDRGSLNKQWQDEKKQSENMLYSAGAVWAGNLIWTLLRKDEEAQYRKIKTDLKFNNVTSTGEISFLYSLGGSKTGR